MPSPPTRNPVLQKHAATNIAARGPLRSTQVPKIAAETPSTTMAREKAMPMAVSPVSKLLTSAFL